MFTICIKATTISVQLTRLNHAAFTLSTFIYVKFDIILSLKAQATSLGVASVSDCDGMPLLFTAVEANNCSVSA